MGADNYSSGRTPIDELFAVVACVVGVPNTLLDRVMRIAHFSQATEGVFAVRVTAVEQGEDLIWMLSVRLS